ncbi:MAG: hypothetical protein KAR54_01310 [Candidatus Pacebacteria bacterium]|nr:hypothetical protein [Candidatus Paceibacterota bacterium]
MDEFEKKQNKGEPDSKNTKKPDIPVPFGMEDLQPVKEPSSTKATANQESYNVTKPSSAEAMTVKENSDTAKLTSIEDSGMVKSVLDEQNFDVVETINKTNLAEENITYPIEPTQATEKKAQKKQTLISKIIPKKILGKNLTSTTSSTKPVSPANKIIVDKKELDEVKQDSTTFSAKSSSDAKPTSSVDKMVVEKAMVGKTVDKITSTKGSGMVKPSSTKDMVGKKKSVSIRTYQDDMADLLKKDGLSVTGAIIAEQIKKENIFSKVMGVEKATKKNIILLITSISIILIGISSIILMYFLRPTPIVKISDVELNSIIYSEYQREIFLDQTNKIKLSQLIENEIFNTDIPMGSLIHLYLTDRESNASGELSKKLIDINTLSNLLDFRVSDTFLRFIEKDFMFGFYSSFGNKPFLILKTESFENSFPEMLKWETNMIEDLRAVFVEENPAIITSQLRKGVYQFKDIVVKNRDARAILDNEGNIIFVYAFADKNTIVIATNKNTLQEIFNRLTISYRTR